jgi:threonine dehydratase
VEPETADDALQSLQKGSIVSIDYPETIADGVRTLSLGSLTFPIIQRNVAGILTVSEDGIKTALLTLMKYSKQWLEPSAVLGLAALLEKQIEPATEVGIILSGGNADISTIQTIEEQAVALPL